MLRDPGRVAYLTVGPVSRVPEITADPALSRKYPAGRVEPELQVSGLDDTRDG
jgi:hypothetical protein